jgi:hypothetical protein
MNALILSGKLIATPSFVRLPNGVEKCEFGISTNVPRGTMELSCVAYGKQSEKLGGLTEGETVLVTGKLTDPGFAVVTSVERL